MYNDKINEVLNEIKDLFNNITDKKLLEDIKNKYIGKSGKITLLQQLIKEIPKDEKRDFGIKLNELKTKFNEAYSKIMNDIELKEINNKLESERIDVTLPSKKVKRGSIHPMTRIQEEFEDIFTSMGYTVYDGPEIESDENCFQKLNLPKGHPARDAQDTFYLKDEYEKFLIRSQTSTAQVRAMEANKDKGPLRIVCPGKV